MTAPSSTFTATETAFHVETYEKVDYSLLYVDGAFRVGNPEIADSYRPLGRCLMVVDETVYGLYGEQMHAYFDHHGIALTVFPVTIREPDKTLGTVEITSVEEKVSFGTFKGTDALKPVRGDLVVLPR